MKGMIFVGCSFTHGHGLWHYGDFSNTPSVDADDYNRRYALIRYASIHRFPRLVSNHFNTWEFVRDDYSGDDEDSVGILHKMFKIDERLYYYGNQFDVYNFEDISHVIFQTSYIDRCSYIYNSETKDRLNLNEIEENKQIEILLKWGFSNIEDFYNKLIEQWYCEIRNLFDIFESKGIKCYMMSITNDYLELIENDSFIKDRFIKINYEGIEFNTISELMQYDESLIIKNDYVNLKNPPLDSHPSLECHKIIANSIIKKIEQNG